MSDLNHHIVTANGVEHHVVVAGTGPPVICVHGFPEDWYSFRHLYRKGILAIRMDGLSREILIDNRIK